ncbi:IS1 family transposase [Sulfolobus sp. E11-6]|nr:IS1 family transposase [Sulfolobus sp. E11-6]
MRVSDMDLAVLAQLILLILRNLNLKPRKYALKDIALSLAYSLGVQITKIGIPPSTLYYYLRKVGIRRRREKRPTCPSCNSNRVVKNGSSRGKAKYRCKVCGRTFYNTLKHRMNKEQRERILKEYLNRMSMRAISRVEGKPLTTIYSLVKRIGAKAFTSLIILRGQLKSFVAKSTVFDEFWTYLRVRHGKVRADLWIWTALSDGIPFYESGDRSYGTFRLLLSWLPRSGVNYTDHYCVYQVLDKRVASKKYTYIVESHNSRCRSHLARLARDTRAVNRSQRMVEYSLALLNVMYPHVFSREITPLNETYLRAVQYIRDNLI